ncbi:MAG: hypothetical protein M1833_003849 [Piccolia ochrophora]|nr:MAG: hypothetical protein M1833_003849 [Piccolia ochrophora]
MPQRSVSQGSLPVSSGSSDVTDTSVSLSDANQYASGPLSDHGLTSSLGVFSVPAPHPGIPIAESGYTSDQAWQSEGVQAFETPFPFSHPYAPAVGPPSEPYGTQAEERMLTTPMNTMGMDSLGLQGTMGDNAPLSSHPMSRNNNSSRTVSLFSVQATESSSNAYTPPQLSGMFSSSRRSSVTQADSVSIESSVSVLAQDYASPYHSAYQHIMQAPVSPGFSHEMTNSRSSEYPTFSEPMSAGGSLAMHQELDVDETLGLSPLSGPAHLQMGEEMGPGSARTHHLYQASPEADGLYHCPYEGTEGCDHKASKLKCNYDKYIDSHLKPYRCKVTSCGDQQFSSTACLLRHEREAHGMYGHGTKPFECPYHGCERSGSGNGFPRRWNLYDHMRRVHDYTGPPSNGSESPTASINSTTAGTQPPTKRKSSVGQQGQQGKKSKSKNPSKNKDTTPPAVQRDTVSERQQQLQTLSSECSQLHSHWRKYSQTLQASQAILRGQHLDEQIRGVRHVASELERLEMSLQQLPKTSGIKHKRNVHPD